MKLKVFKNILSLIHEKSRCTIFHEQIKKLTQKAIGTLITLYPLLNRNFRLNNKNKCLIYKVVVRSASSYACPACSIIRNRNFKKLQIVKNIFLKLPGNYNKFTFVKKMLKLLNIEYLYDYVKRITKNYFERIKTHKSPPMRQILASRVKSCLYASDFFIFFWNKYF